MGRGEGMIRPPVLIGLSHRRPVKGCGYVLFGVTSCGALEREEVALVYIEITVFKLPGFYYRSLSI